MPDPIHSVKERQDKVLTKGVYEIPNECWTVYIGETVSTKLNEHYRYILLPQFNLSDVAENAIVWSHSIDLEDIDVLAMENRLWNWNIREEIEIHK